MNRKENTTGYAVTYDIYVGNVPKHITERDLKKLFVKYGEIKQVLCRWKDDYIGYGIVKFALKEDADRALKDTYEVFWNGNIMPIKAARRSDGMGNPGIQNEAAPPVQPKPLPEKKRNQYYPPPPPPPPLMKNDFGYFHRMNYTEENQSQPMMLEVLCTNVENAVTFFGCMVNRFEELAHLSHALNGFALSNWNTNQRHDRRLYNQTVYAAMFSEDKSWYRCIVVRSNLPDKSDMCTVRYVDYGNQEDIFKKSIIDLPDSLQKIPPFASKFYLYNLEPESQPPKPQSYLHQLVNKRMSLCAVKSSTSREYQVLKCSCNGKDVISESIKKGFAKTQSFTPPKTLKDKPKAFHSGSDIVIQTSSAIPPPFPASQLTNGRNENNFPKPRRLNKINGEAMQCNGFHDDAKTEGDFPPMRIIKRGSELRDILGPKKSPKRASDNATDGSSQSTVVKDRKQPSSFLMDNVIANLKLINNIRGLVSQSTDDSVISQAVDLLKSEITMLEPTEDAVKSVSEKLDKYSESLAKMKKCLNRGDLPTLKTERDVCRTNLSNVLKEYIDNFDQQILRRKDQIQKAIMDLESNSNAWMNVQLEKRPATIEELVTEYNKVKEERWNMVCDTRESTNQKHKHVMEVLSGVQKELYLNTLDGTDNGTNDVNVSNIEKSVSHFEKWTGALKDLGKAVDEEIRMLTLTKDKNSISVIQCLLDGLDIHKEKIESICELYLNRSSLYDELCRMEPYEPTVMKLTSAVEEVANISSHLGQFRNLHEEKSIDDLSSELCPILKELHLALLKEETLKEKLAKDSDSCFPELNIEHPEFKFSDYLRYKFILKKNWKTEFFPREEIASRGKSTYLSKLVENPVFIKEYVHEVEDEKLALLQRAIKWNEIKNDYLVKVEGVFYEAEMTTSIMLSPAPSKTLFDCPPNPTPSEGLQAARVLKQVMFSLKDIHDHGITHGAVHPMNVLIQDEKVFLDLCVDLNNIEDNICLKGINFKPPNKTHIAAHLSTSDMYGYGCLVLWVLFRNLTFTSIKEEVPNISGFRSIIEQLMSPKDYAQLSKLVGPKPEHRPTSSCLINRGFLDHYEAFCQSRIEGAAPS